MPLVLRKYFLFHHISEIFEQVILVNEKCIPKAIWPLAVCVLDAFNNSVILLENEQLRCRAWQNCLNQISYQDIFICCHKLSELAHTVSEHGLMSLKVAPYPLDVWPAEVVLNPKQHVGWKVQKV